MDIDYGPALPPCLDSHSRVIDASGHNVLSRKPRGCPRPNQRNLLTLSNNMMWPRALPQTTTLINLMNLGLHLAETRNILINQNTNLVPDIYLLPQRRHRSHKPSRKTYTDQDHPQHHPDPPYYREVALTSPLSMQRRWIPLGVSSNFQTLGTPYPGLQLRSWALTMRKAGRSSGQEALPLCCL